jgi:hypothetical protein
MIVRHLRLLAGLTMLIVAWPFCFGQQAASTVVTNVSAPPIPGVGHDYVTMLNEIVSPGNGSVSLRIPLPIPAGRGLNFPLSLTYDSNAALVLQQQPGANGLIWLPQKGILTVGGWSLNIPKLTNNVSSYTLDTPDQNLGDGSGQCDMLTGYTFTDLDLTSHALGLSYIYDNISVDPQGNPLGPSQASQLDTACTAAASAANFAVAENIAFSSGPSQYTITPTASPDPIYQAALTQIPPDQNFVPTHGSSYPGPQAVPVVTGPDGTVYTFPAGSGYCDTSVYLNCTNVPSSIEDRNGNIISMTESPATHFNAKDTAGRPVFSVDAFPQQLSGGPTTTAIPMADGSVYTLTWGLKSYGGYSVTATGLNPQVGCPASAMIGMGDSPHSEIVLTQLTLPNGKSYTFQYDSTNGTLSQITYPDGGYAAYGYAVQPDYGFVTSSISGNGTCAQRIGVLMVTTRSVGFTNPDGSDQSPIETQNLTYGPPILSDGWPTNRTTTMQTNDAVSGTHYQTIYNYVGTAAGAMELSVIYEDSNYAAIKTVTKSWFGPSALACEVDTIGSSGLSRGTLYGYGLGDVLNDKLEYDYGQITPSACTISNSSRIPGTTLPSGTPARETTWQI